MEVTREQDEAMSRELASHAEALQDAIEAGLCLKCGCDYKVELNPRNITFKCISESSCGWFALYPIRTIGNSERAMRDESLDLIAISEREVIEKAKAWHAMVKKEYDGINIADESDALLAAVTLLNSRVAMDATRHLDNVAPSFAPTERQTQPV